MTHSEMADEMRRLSRLLDSGLTAMRDQAKELADAEDAYGQAVSVAWAQAPEGTVPEREAWVRGQTASKRHRRDLAEHMGRAALEAVRSRRTQISALQSLLNAERAEMEFARTGPETT